MAARRVVTTFNLYNKGDFKALEEFYAPEVAFWFNVPRTIAPCGGGPHRGRDGFIEGLRFYYYSYQWIEHEVLDVTGDGATIVVRRRCLARNRGAGRRHVLNSCTIHRLSDGAITEISDYSDTFVMRQLTDWERSSSRRET